MWVRMEVAAPSPGSFPGLEVGPTMAETPRRITEDKIDCLSESRGSVVMNTEQVQFVQTDNGQDRVGQGEVPPRFF